MSAIRSFADVIDAWPSPSALADDLRNVTVITVRSWKRRGIPDAYWVEIVESARRRGILGISYELLATLAARPRPVLGAAA